MWQYFYPETEKEWLLTRKKEKGMKEFKETTIVNTWNYKTINPPVRVDFIWEAYESYPEMVSSNEQPTPDEMLAYRNKQRKMRARAQAIRAAMELHEKETK